MSTQPHPGCCILPSSQDLTLCAWDKKEWNLGLEGCTLSDPQLCGTSPTNFHRGLSCSCHLHTVRESSDGNLSPCPRHQQRETQGQTSPGA